MLLLQSNANARTVRANAQTGAMTCVVSAVSTSAVGTGYRGQMERVIGRVSNSISNIWSCSAAQTSSNRSTGFNHSARFAYATAKNSDTKGSRKGSKQAARKSNEHQSYGLLEMLQIVLMKRGTAY
jgi:hypothetical protein